MIAIFLSLNSPSARSAQSLPCWSSRPQVRKASQRPRSVTFGLVADGVDRGKDGARQAVFFHSTAPFVSGAPKGRPPVEKHQIPPWRGIRACFCPSVTLKKGNPSAVSVVLMKVGGVSGGAS